MNKREKFIEWMSDVFRLERQTHQGTGGQDRIFNWRPLSSESDQYSRKITKATSALSLSEQTKVLKEFDPSISRIYNDSVIFPVLDYELTCENSRGQQILDNFELELVRKRNSLNTILSKLFGSIKIYGEFCFELTFDPLLVPANLFVINPNTLDYRSVKDENGNEYWELGQWDEENEFIVLDPDRVYIDVINALPDELHGSSLIAAAFEAAIASNQISHDYVDIMEYQNYRKRYAIFKATELIKAGATPEQVKQAANEAANTFEAHLKTNDNTKMPFFTNDIEYKQLDGGNSGISEADIIDRVEDRKIIRGGGAEPAHLGSNEFAAESSARSQALRDSIKTEAYQKRVEKMINYALSQALRNLGVIEPAKLMLKRVDVVEREAEADIARKAASSISDYIRAGLSPGTAVKLYSTMTDTYIPEGLLEQIEREYTEIQQRESNNDETDEVGP